MSMRRGWGVWPGLVAQHKASGGISTHAPFRVVGLAEGHRNRRALCIRMIRTPWGSPIEDEDFRLCVTRGRLAQS